MTELEKMKLAKSYIERLANGVDPLTGRIVADDDVINNIHISRCLFYVSEVMGRVINNGGEIAPQRPSGKRTSLELTQDDLADFEISDEPIKISEFSRRLNDIADRKNMTHLGSANINKWLVQAGLLEEQKDNNGSTIKLPTAAGEELGISAEAVWSQYGKYWLILYDKKAQKFLLDNIEAIAAMKKRGREQ